MKSPIGVKEIIRHTLTEVETACTLFVLRRMDEANDATLKPIAHEVYPFNLITS